MLLIELRAPSVSLLRRHTVWTDADNRELRICEPLVACTTVCFFLFRSAVEDHVRAMESTLDEELIQALDGAIAEKIEHNLEGNKRWVPKI